MAKTRVEGQDVLDGSLTAADVAAANKDGLAAVPSLRTLGTGAQQSAAGNSVPLVAQSRSDVVRSATSFGDVAGLSFPVAAGKDYYFEFGIIYRSAATNTGINIAVNGPLSPISMTLLVTIPFLWVGSARVYNFGTPSLSIDTANVDSLAHMHGILRNGPNSGILIARFASSRSGTNVTVGAGSFVRYHQLN